MKKNYYTMTVGRRQHTVNFHNGEETHQDGSPFFDMQICSSKKKQAAFVRELIRQGYTEGKQPIYL